MVIFTVQVLHQKVICQVYKILKQWKSHGCEASIIHAHTPIQYKTDMCQKAKIHLVFADMYTKGKKK